MPDIFINDAPENQTLAETLRAMNDALGDERDAIFERYLRERYADEKRELQFRGEPVLFSLADMNRMLGAVAAQSVLEPWHKTDGISPLDFRNVIKKSITAPAPIVLGDVPEFIKLIERFNLIIRVKEDTWAFSHPLVRDYFAFHHALHMLSFSLLEGRWLAPIVLGRSGDPRAFEPLVAALCDAENWIRNSAAIALGLLGDSRAIDPLVKALHDNNASVRSNAAEGLGRTGDARAIDPLITALGDEQIWGVPRALVQFGEAAVDPLLAALSDTDSRVRSAAASTLAQIGDVRAVEPLIAALYDVDIPLRRSSAIALGKIGDIRAVEPLLDTLHDADDEVRGCVVDALAWLDDKRAIEPLFDALQDSASWVRHRAFNALSKWFDTRAVKPLIAVLRDENSLMRKRAAEVLGQLGDTRAIEPLITQLTDTERPHHWLNKRICDYAAAALTQIGTPEALAAVKRWRAAQKNR